MSSSNVVINHARRWVCLLNNCHDVYGSAEGGSVGNFARDETSQTESWASASLRNPLHLPCSPFIHLIRISSSQRSSGPVRRRIGSSPFLRAMDMPIFDPRRRSSVFHFGDRSFQNRNDMYCRFATHSWSRFRSTTDVPHTHDGRSLVCTKHMPCFAQGKTLKDVLFYTYQERD
jgi:hypothetical protein